MIQGSNRDEWRADPPTDKQLQAIDNMVVGWGIIDNEFRREPKTKGEAYDMLQKLFKIAASLARRTTHYRLSNDECLYRQEMGDMEGDPFFYGQ